MTDAKAEYLRSKGFVVGDRDPNQNRAFAGRFMVAEEVTPNDLYPTDDAGDGRFCIVGDDLKALMEQTLCFFEGMDDRNINRDLT